LLFRRCEFFFFLRQWFLFLFFSSPFFPFLFFFVELVSTYPPTIPTPLWSPSLPPVKPPFNLELSSSPKHFSSSGLVELPLWFVCLCHFGLFFFFEQSFFVRVFFPRLTLLPNSGSFACCLFSSWTSPPFFFFYPSHPPPFYRKTPFVSRAFFRKRSHLWTGFLFFFPFTCPHLGVYPPPGSRRTHPPDDGD